MLVRAIRTHGEPPTGRYREEGEEFDHSGPLYKHVEPVQVEEAETPNTIGPDAKCPCGSNKKYKNCCGKNPAPAV